MEAKTKDDLQKVTKMIKLKKEKLRDEILAYFRANIMHQQDKEHQQKIVDKAAASNDPKKVFVYEGTASIVDGQSSKPDHHKHLLVSSPVDPQFEMLVVACTINLLESLQKSKFRGPLDKDLEMLKMDSLSSRKRIALTNRIG